MDHKVILQPAGIAVEHEINSRIEIAIADSGIRGAIGFPLCGVRPEETAGHGGMGIVGLRWYGPRPGKRHPDAPGSSVNRGAAGFQENGLMAALTTKLRWARGFKSDGQAGVSDRNR